MLFTYTFGEKLDLTRFRKQAAHYMGNMNEINYDLYLPHYKIKIESSTVKTKATNSNAHIATISIFDIKRDDDGEIKREEVIFPLLDSRFKESKDIQAVFLINDTYRGNFISNSTQDTVEKLCCVIKLVHKIDHLKAFL